LFSFQSFQSFNCCAPFNAFGGSRFNVQKFKDRLGGELPRFGNSRNVETLQLFSVLGDYMIDV